MHFCFPSSLRTGNLELFSVTAALKNIWADFSSVTVFYSMMFSISLLFVVIPAMSMDVSYAGGTLEIWDGAQKKLIFFWPAPWFLFVLASASNCIFWRLFSVQKPRIEAGSALLLPAAWRSWIFNAFSCSAPDSDCSSWGLWHGQLALLCSVLDRRRLLTGGVLAPRVPGELCSPA